MTRRVARASVALGIGALIFVVEKTLSLGPSFRLIAFTAVVLVIVVMVTRPDPREARVRAGRCRHCDYDLRGTRGRCPECGKLVPPGTPIRRE
jgi:hypothetical protein